MPAIRLTVTLNERSADDLDRVAQLEQSNKSTAVNRAIQVYTRLVELQHRGGAVVLEYPDAPPERVLFT